MCCRVYEVPSSKRVEEAGVRGKVKKVPEAVLKPQSSTEAPQAASDSCHGRVALLQSCGSLCKVIMTFVRGYGSRRGFGDSYCHQINTHSDHLHRCLHSGKSIGKDTEF